MKRQRERHEIAWRNGRWEWRRLWRATSHTRGKPSRNVAGWVTLTYAPVKSHLVSVAAAALRGNWDHEGRSGELQIKGTDGRIQDCRRYGRGSRGTRG